MDWVKHCGEIIKKIEKLEPKLTPEENVVCDILCENIETIPPEFFAECTVEELNEHFGGTGPMAITPRIKEYMTLFQEQSFVSYAMLEVYGGRATEEDNAAMKDLLKTHSDAADVKDQDEEIIENFLDLEMTPPDMYDSYDNFKKYLPNVYPGCPPIGPRLFEKIKERVTTE